MNKRVVKFLEKNNIMEKLKLGLTRTCEWRSAYLGYT